MTMKSWRIDGNASGTRFERNGLMSDVDQQVDDRGREHQPLERAQVAFGAGDVGALPDDEVEEGVEAEQEQRELELPPDEIVEREGTDEERRGKSRDARDQMCRVVREHSAVRQCPS